MFFKYLLFDKACDLHYILKVNTLNLLINATDNTVPRNGEIN